MIEYAHHWTVSITNGLYFNEFTYSPMSDDSPLNTSYCSSVIAFSSKSLEKFLNNTCGFTCTASKDREEKKTQKSKHALDRVRWHQLHMKRNRKMYRKYAARDICLIHTNIFNAYEETKHLTHMGDWHDKCIIKLCHGQTRFVYLCMNLQSH